jgi:3-oxoacyl-[acyl-carrier-protein] synthase II
LDLNRRVAVTGIGLITPLGTGAEATWSGLVEGRSGIGPVTLFDASELKTRFAGEVNDFVPEDFFSKKEARRLERSQAFALAASDMAMKDGGFALSPEVAQRGAVIIGSAVGGLAMAETEYQKVLARGPRAMNPLFILGVLPNMLPAQVAIRHGFKGPNWGTNSACSTSAHALGEAARLIRHGDVDVALAGGAEAPICVMGMGGFSAIRALSTRNEDPQGASRPFDRDRDGFVLGEGSAVLLLEEWSSAIERGARVYGELVGYGVTGDAHHLTAPAPGHEGAQRCMKMALAEAGVKLEEVGYINAHATSTEIGDRLEAEAIRAVFGSHAPHIPVSSTKSMTGHLTGASGAAEAAFSLLALHHGIIPPTINLQNPEEGMGLDFVPLTSRAGSLDVVMTNAFGFGGTNVSLVFRKTQEPR